jgi:hypothetical protein
LSGYPTNQELAQRVSKNSPIGLCILRNMAEPQETMPEFASRNRIDQHPEIESDFIRRVLELPWALITDESSLWDFHQDVTNQAFVEKIRAVYGIDVSDIPQGNIADILGRIARKS